MMRLTASVLTLILICALAATAQPDRPPDTLWTRRAGTAGDEVGWAVCNAWDGGSLVAGQAGTTGAGPFDFLLVHFGANGELLWSRTYGGTGSDIARAVQPSADGGYVAAGTTTSFGAQLQDIWILKVNGSGDSLWSRRYGGAEVEEAAAMVRTADGGFVLAGNVSLPGANRDALLMKISASGDSLWRHTYGTAQLEWILAMAATEDGFILAGGADRTGPGREIYLARTDHDGTLIWDRTYGGWAFDEAAGVRTTSDGGFIVCGSTQSIGAGNRDAFLLKTDSAGDTAWWRAFGTAGLDQGIGVLQTSDGGFVAGGYTPGTGGFADFSLVKTDAAGVQQWSTAYGGTYQDGCYAMEKTSDGGFALAGYSESYTAGQRDVYMVRLSGFSGVGGYIYESGSNQPLRGAHVGALGSSLFGTTDSLGHYLLVLPPGPADLIVFGQCVERDTLRGLEIIQDSIRAVDWHVGVPAGRVDQTSVNIVAPNHASNGSPFVIRNDGAGLLDYAVVARATEPEGNWLSVSTERGMLPSGQTTEIVVNVHADTADVGVYDYFGYVDVHMNSCPDSVVRVVITAVVVNGAAPQVRALPREYSLSAYPNPFNPSTHIAFELPEAQRVTLRVYDMLGRELGLLEQGHFSAGSHRVLFAADALPTGIYFVRLDAGPAQLTRKLLLLK